MISNDLEKVKDYVLRLIRKNKINDQIPDVEIYQLVNGEPQKSKLMDTLAKKIIFGLPGAFTSTCSNSIYQAL